MSRHMPLEDQAEILSHLDDTGDSLNHEDAFTAGRPPQYNDSNGVPQSIVKGPTPSQIHDIENRYPASCRTDSTSTVLADNAAAVATTVPIREYIFHYVNRDYDGATQPLTEHAIAALNNDFCNASYNGNVGEWVCGRSQFLPSDPVDLNLSVFRGPRTRTDSTMGSSWTKVSSMAPSNPQREHVAEVICAAGQQFADVPAHPALPMGPTLPDEDLR